MKTEVVVGDRRPVPLTSPPAGLDVIVISAPRGAPVLVRVIDEGRAQSIDLRTGKPVDVLAIYARPHTGYTNFGYNEPGTIRIGGISRQLTTTIIAPTTGQLSAGLEPWIPKGGWAAPGRAWLVAGNLTAATLRLTHDGSVVGNKGKATWATRPPAKEFPLTITA